MGKVKRYLSLLLVTAMITSFMYLPVCAADVPCTITVSNVAATVTETSGQDITVDIDISNLSEGEGWSGLTLYLYYDSEIMEYKSQKTGSTFNAARTAIQNANGSVNAVVSAGKDTQDANENGRTDEACVGIACTATDENSDPARMTGNGTLWTLTFAVNANLESQELPLELVCLDATVNEDDTAKPATVNGTLTVNGVAPTLNEVTLASSSVEVDGANAQAVQAKAASVKGTDITAGVDWSVVPTSDDVTVSSTGLVTVAPKAAAGEYTVTAAPGAGTQGSEKTAVLTVTRAASALTSVSVNPTSVTVDGTNGASATATAFDQFGDPISSAVWSVDPAGKGVSAPGGVVSVAADAVAGSYTIKASVGDAEKTAVLTVERAGADQVKSFTVTASPASVAVPTVDAADAEVELGVADVLNVYGDPVADPTVSYALKGSYAGVSISGNVITVTSGAAANAFQSGSLSVEVEATVGGLTKSAAVTLTREASVAATIAVSGGSAELEVPASGAAPAVSAPFTAVVTDQYGAEISDAEVVWSVTDKTGVSISNGIVSVSDQAKDSIAGSAVLTVTAKSGSASGTKTLTVKRAAPVAARVSVSGGSSAILVPADGAAANRSDAFTAVAYDQYGAAISGADITWSVTDNGTPVEGIQIDGGVVTVANAAKAAIADTTGKALTVTAACGGVVSAPASITVKRDVPAAKDVKFFSGSAEVTADTIGIPTSGTAAKTYAAVAYDQYGAEMSAAPALTVSGAVPAGITVADGTVSVTSGTADGASVTLKAALGGVTKTLTITAKTVSVDWSPIAAKSSITYGDTKRSAFTAWSASGTATAYVGGSVTTLTGTFTIDGVDTLLTVEDETITVTFTVDANGGAYAGNTFTKSFHVEVAPRTVTVAPGTYKLTKTYDGTTAAGTPSGALAVTNILTADSGVKVAPASVPAYTSADAHTEQLTLALSLSGDKSANYTLETASVQVPAEITKATLTAIGTAAPTASIKANDAKNAAGIVTAAGNAVIALPASVSVTYGGGQTADVGMTWANAAQTWNPKGGTYTFVGTTAADGNFANTLKLTATLTVTPVTITAITGVPASITKAKGEVTGGALTAMGFPETVTLVFDSGVESQSVVAAWDTTVEQLVTLAGKVNDAAPTKTATVTLTGACLPAWATYTGAMPAVTFTITNNYPVDVTISGVADKVYDGEPAAAPVTTVTEIDGKGIGDSANAWKITYTGTTKGGAAYSGEARPTEAGSYTVTAVYDNGTHFGQASRSFVIEQKEVTLIWTDPASLTYDGTAKTVTAAAGGLVGSDVCDVTVTGGTATNAGAYTAAAAGLSNANYRLGAEKTHAYTIAKADRELTVTPELMKLVPGELTGAIAAATSTNADGSASYTYSSDATTVAMVDRTGKVTGTANGTAAITVGIPETNNYYGVSKTVAVKVVAAPITGVTVSGGTVTASVEGTVIKVAGSTSDVSALTYAFTTAAVDGITISAPAVENGQVKVTVEGREIVYTIDTSAVTVLPVGVTVVKAEGSIADGAENALPQSVIDQAVTAAAGSAATVEVKVVLEGNQLKATYEVKAGGEKKAEGTLTSLTQPVTVTLPDAYAANQFVKHTSGSSVEYLAAASNGGKVSFETSDLSGTFEVVTNTDSVEITFVYEDGSVQTVAYTPADIGKALPMAGKAGYTFSGWTVGGKTYAVVTEELLAVGGSQTAEPSFRQNGGSSGGGSGTTTYAVTVAKSKNGTVTVSPKSAAKGATVTVTVKADEGYVLDTLAVYDRDGGRVKVTEGKNGKFTFTMPAGKVTVEATFAQVQVEWPFTDVADTFWARESIAWAYENGYMNGTSASTFHPNGSVTRQQLWMILARLSGQRPANMAEARVWAVENGVSDGTNPGNAVSRQQMVAILYRYAKLMGYALSGSTELAAFPDSGKVADYAKDALSWSVANGIVGGTTQGTLNPTGTANRAQFATILKRFCENIVG